MKNRWTLHVEDFGSIRSADIEVAPMMLFVGENNTGKSYLASLLWGISEMGYISDEILNSEKASLVQRIFSNREINIGKLNINYSNQSDKNTESRHSVYLPASRTGFMLSYKPLIAELMNHWGLDKPEIQTTFTLPTIRFLQKLIKAEMSPETPFADIAESLEKQILKGKIIQNSQTQSFYYVPESSQKIMPLHTTSSLVTELAPLIIFLKDTLSKFNLLVFEEPESHLHLSAQRILAKHLVKLVNRGLPVWITTHSDTMFQQFNNLIGSTEKRIRKLKNLSYQDDEMIKPDDIKAYQFNIADDGKTDVVSLKLTDDGFSASNFNHTLWNLSKESMSLEAD